VDECKPLPSACGAGWVGETPGGEPAIAAAVPAVRGLHSFTLELNLSDSMTHS